MRSINSNGMGEGQIMRFVALMLALLTLMTVITAVVVLIPDAKPASAGLPDWDIPSGTTGNSGNTDTPSNNYPAVTDWQNASTAPKISLPSSVGAFGDDIKSTAAILVDMSSGSATCAKNADQRVPIASMTKVMTLIVALDLIKSNDTFYEKVKLDPDTRADLAKDKYQLAFNIDDEEAYVIDLLYTLILQSGCDSACALAKHLAGSEENFVDLMNKKAEALGLKNTHFANSYGGDHDNNYSTVREVGVIFLYALENELAEKIITTKTGDYKFYGKYINYMYAPSLVLDAFKNHSTGGITVLGGKSGLDEQAGYCLVSFGRDASGNKYLVVTAGNNAERSSYTDSARIYKDYVN
ncbi:MAG: hypothetical protein IJX46_08485 [Clostridia bacterium]|nr:hypothetical protein [Clostridia bacterium]